MASPVEKPTYEMGLLNHFLADKGGLIPPAALSGNPFVWILSSSLPQPQYKQGVWFDSASWVDTNLWYD